MRFFTDITGNVRPISAILKIGEAREVTFKPSGRKGNVHIVDLINDQRCEISENERREIMETPIYMVPAQPETFMLHPIGEADSEDDRPWQTPIVAWAYTGEGFFVPFTAEGAHDGMRESGPIRYPNGMVVEVCGESWRTYDDFLASKRAERDGKAV